MGKSQSKVDPYAAIRRDHRGGLLLRALQRKYNVTWRTVRRAPDGPWPEERKKPQRRESRLEPYKPLIDDILRADPDAPAKQRHTAQRIFDRLVDEHGAGDISYPMVRAYVRDRRLEVRRAAGLGPQAMFVPQTHLPGAEAEVDFGEVHVVPAGELTRVCLFSLRLSYSGKAVRLVFATAGQEAFFEGHVHAFRVLGGVPRARIRYDNLRAVVERVLGFSRGRVEADRWTAFRSHWGVEPFYCRPGIEGAHEKGGVEGQIGYFRRNHFVPVPEVGSLTELNVMIDRWDQADEGRRLRGRTRTIGDYFVQEQHLLRPLPTGLFATGRWFAPRVNRFSQIGVRGNAYSVPVRFSGRQPRVPLHANDLIVHDGRTVVARHERLGGRHGSRLVLDHYLEALLRKPGAFPGATALEQARSAGRFTPVHDKGWAAAKAAHGDAAGTRALIEALLPARHMDHEQVVAGLAAAYRAGALTGAHCEPLRPTPPTAWPHGRREGRIMTRKRGLTEEAAIASIDQACRMLRLPTIRQQFKDLADGAAREQMSYRAFLAELLMAVCDDRARRRSERRVRAASFPRDKSLRAFDFDANPDVDPVTSSTLATCEWVKKGEPLCLIGDSGTGTSHLLIALGAEAAMQGFRVRYVLATKLVKELVEAADEKHLSKTIARHGRVDLLCTDELGYMELDRRGAELLFRVLTEREEKNSVAIASNESFSGWTKTFTDPRLCAAIVDRLPFNGAIIQPGTDSHRLAPTKAQVDRARAS